MAETPPLTGIDHVTNICTDMEATKAFYEDVLGFVTVKMTENYDDPGTPHYYFAPSREAASGTIITYFEYPDGQGTPGPGASHHYALGVEDEATLRAWQTHLREQGVDVSDVRDRTYFKSIYFEDPDGLTIEICTTGPGFDVDEAVPGSEVISAPERSDD